MRVTREFLSDAVESPFGDFIYAQRAREEIWQIPIRGGTATPVPELRGVKAARYWTLADDKLYFVRQEQLPRQLESLDLKTRQIRRITEIPGELLPGHPAWRWIRVHNLCCSCRKVNAAATSFAGTVI